MSDNRKRESYRADVKLIIAEKAEKVGNREAARLYQVDEKCVRQWRLKKDELMKMDCSRRSNRHGPPGWPALDDRLSRWIIAERETGREISKLEIRKVASAMASEMGFSEFKGNLSWCYRFLKRKKLTGKDKKTMVPVDGFCWHCHKEGELFECKTCPRSFHQQCDPHASSQDCQWSCLECTRITDADAMDNRSPAMALFSPDQLKTLLEYALLKLKQQALIDFHNPVSNQDYPSYLEYIAHPMDLSLLEKNVEDRLYENTEAFLADVKWIHHNSIIFNGDKHMLTAEAKLLVDVAREEMNEIEVCPDCYLHKKTMEEKWFLQPCRWPHVLVWAKRKGHPYIPGKALRVNNGNVEVWFFGSHDRAQVPQQQVFLLSEVVPEHLKSTNDTLSVAVEELGLHVQRLQIKLGGFEYAPPCTPVDVDSLYLKPMNKMAIERRNSAPEITSQPERILPSSFLSTSNWLKKLEEKEPEEPQRKKNVDKEGNVLKQRTSGRIRKPKYPFELPDENAKVNVNLRPRNCRKRTSSTVILDSDDQSLNVSQEFDVCTTSENLDVTDEYDEEFQNKMIKVQEEIAEDNQNEMIVPDILPNLQESKDNLTLCAISCDKQSNSNLNEQLSSEKLNVVCKNFNQRVRSSKTKLNIKHGKVKHETVQMADKNVDPKTENDSLQNEESTAKLCSVSEVPTQTEIESDSPDNKCVIDMDISDNRTEPSVEFNLLRKALSENTCNSVTVSTNESENLDNSESRAIAVCQKKQSNGEINSEQLMKFTNCMSGLMNKDTVGEATNSAKNYNIPRTTIEQEHNSRQQLAIYTGESQIGSYAQNVFLDFLKELGHNGGSNPHARIKSLESELEKQSRKHQQEMVEIKHNTDLLLLKARSDLQLENEKALNEVKRKHDVEMNKAIERLKRKLREERKKFLQEKKEIKKKHWCANCQKEAIYYCCRHTSYCDNTCQQAHWTSHQATCRRNSPQDTNSQSLIPDIGIRQDDSSSTSRDTTSTTTLRQLLEKK